MASTERVTITLPLDLLRDIDRREKNRSRFVAQAIRNELALRRHHELCRSLEQPHAESNELVEEGLGEWEQSLPDEDTDLLVERGAGQSIRWVAGEGWLPN